MKILYISDTFPQFHAPGGAPTKFFCELREIAKKHKITLLTTKWPGVEININETKTICDDIIFYDFVSEEKRENFLMRKLIGKKNVKRLEEIKKILIEDFHIKFKSSLYKSFKSKINSIHLNEFDLIQFVCLSVAYRAEYIKKICPGVPLILESFDIGSLIAYREFKYAKTPRWKIYLYFMWKKALEYEKRVSFLFDKILTVSDIDKRLLLNLNPNAKIEIIPNGVDTDFFSSEDNAKEPHSLNFVGSNWPPNVDAMVYFFSEIWHRIKMGIPDAKIYVIGSVGDNTEVKRFHNGDDIIVTGNVKDVREWVLKSVVSIVPLRLGGGTRVKILEAMSMRKPVVSTSMGCEGLGVTSDENIIIADSSQDFASNVIYLLNDKDAQLKVGLNARKFVEVNYDWKGIGNRLNKVYEYLLKNRI